MPHFEEIRSGVVLNGQERDRVAVILAGPSVGEVRYAWNR
jgi:hypothetical protein